MDAQTLAGFALVGFVALTALSIVWHSLRLGISPMPSSGRVTSAMLALIPPDAQGPFIELGAGWGGLAFALADTFPNTQVVAFEASPVPYAMCRLRQVLARRSNLTIQRQDFFEADLQTAGVVTCFLFTGAMERLKEKLRIELRPGAFVISQTFGMRGCAPERIVEVPDLFRTRIFCYRAPWSAREGSGSASLE
jgi:hypothetical protein